MSGYTSCNFKTSRGKLIACKHFEINLRNVNLSSEHTAEINSSLQIKTGQTKDSWSLGDRVAPVPWGLCQSCGLIKKVFFFLSLGVCVCVCVFSLSACSICRGTIGASPGPILSAHSAAAPM